MANCRHGQQNAVRQTHSPGSNMSNKSVGHLPGVNGSDIRNSRYRSIRDVIYIIDVQVGLKFFYNFLTQHVCCWGINQMHSCYSVSWLILVNSLTIIHICTTHCTIMLLRYPVYDRSRGSVPSYLSIAYIHYIHFTKMRKTTPMLHKK